MIPMGIPLTTEDALSRFPGALSEVMSRLRSGKSVHREAPPEALTWYLTAWDGAPRPRNPDPYGVGYASGNYPPAEYYRRRFDLSLEKARHAALMTATQSRLTAKIGRWQGSSELIETPPDVVGLFRVGCLSLLHYEKRVRSNPRSQAYLRSLQRYCTVLGELEVRRIAREISLDIPSEAFTQMHLVCL